MKGVLDEGRALVEDRDVARHTTTSRVTQTDTIRA